MRFSLDEFTLKKTIILDGNANPYLNTKYYIDNVIFKSFSLGVIQQGSETSQWHQDSAH